MCFDQVIGYFGQHYLEILVASGTVGMAITTYFSIRKTGKMIRLQQEKEKREARPYLVVKDHVENFGYSQTANEEGLYRLESTSETCLFNFGSGPACNISGFVKYYEMRDKKYHKFTIQQNIVGANGRSNRLDNSFYYDTSNEKTHFELEYEDIFGSRFRTVQDGEKVQFFQK